MQNKNLVCALPKEFVDYLNKNYSAQLGFTVVSENKFATWIDILRQCLRLSLKVDKNAKDYDPDFVNALKPVLAKLYEGYAHPVIPLFKAVMYLKLNDHSLDLTNDCYDGNFGPDLGQFQQNWGIDGASSWRVFETNGMFNNNLVLYNHHDGIYKIRDVARSINKYASQHDDFVEKVGMMATDGTETYDDFSYGIIAYYQYRNKLQVTGIFDPTKTIEYNETKRNVTDPIQLAFYMRGYSSIISWDGYRDYHDDIIQFQRSIGDDINEKLLTQDELQILFDPKSKLTQMASTLDWLRAVHNYTNNYFNSNIDFEYEDEFNLGECKIPTSTGLYFNVKVSVKQNRSATNKLGLDFDKDAPFKLKFTDSSCDFSVNGGKFKLPDGVSESVKSVYKSLTDELTSSLAVDTGQGTVSLDYDNGQITLTIDTLIDKIDINGKVSSLTMKTLLEYKITVGFEDLLKSTYPKVHQVINTAIVTSTATLASFGLIALWQIEEPKIVMNVIKLKLFIENGIKLFDVNTDIDIISTGLTGIRAIFTASIVNCFDEFIKLIKQSMNSAA